MMNKDEAVQKLATAGRLSIAHAEDLYDSFLRTSSNLVYFKMSMRLRMATLLTRQTSFWHWLMSKDIDALTTLVNMHQFGYEVEKEPRYTVRIKGITSKRNCLNYFVEDGKWYINDEVGSVAVRTQHTRKELEQGGFGEVFDNPMFEVEEVE